MPLVVVALGADDALVADGLLSWPSLPAVSGFASSSSAAAAALDDCAFCSSLPSLLAGSGEAGGSRCDVCFGSGFSGRVAIYELMRVSDEIRRMTMTTADARAIRNLALKEGMTEMIADGQEKVASGLTTESELHRVLA